MSTHLSSVLLFLSSFNCDWMEKFSVTRCVWRGIEIWCIARDTGRHTAHTQTARATIKVIAARACARMFHSIHYSFLFLCCCCCWCSLQFFFESFVLLPFIISNKLILIEKAFVIVVSHWVSREALGIHLNYTHEARGTKNEVEMTALRVLFDGVSVPRVDPTNFTSSAKQIIPSVIKDDTNEREFHIRANVFVFALLRIHRNPTYRGRATHMPISFTHNKQTNSNARVRKQKNILHSALQFASISQLLLHIVFSILFCNAA